MHFSRFAVISIIQTGDKDTFAALLEMYINVLFESQKRRDQLGDSSVVRRIRVGFGQQGYHKTREFLNQFKKYKIVQPTPRSQLLKNIYQAS